MINKGIKFKLVLIKKKIMSQETIYKSKFLRILLVIIGSIKYITFQWLTLSAPHKKTQEAHDAALKAAKLSGVKDYVAETQHAEGQLSPETQDWWLNTQVPKIKKEGIENIVIVNPDLNDKAAALKRLKQKEWKESTEFNGVNIHNTDKEGLLTKMQEIALKRKNKK